MDEEHDFFTIFHSRRAAELFAETFNRGTPEGRLYALCGLHATDRICYRELADRFVKENQSVNIIGGRVVSGRTPSEIITNIESGMVEKYISHAKKAGFDR